MVFKEKGSQAHFYLWFSGLVLLLLFLGYVFIYEHKDDELSDTWKMAFVKAGLSKDQVDKLSHDGDVWYYGSPPKSTCVGYGGKDEKCPRFESVCSGEKTFGDINQQVKNVVKAVGVGIHPECPLI